MSKKNSILNVTKTPEGSLCLTFNALPLDATDEERKIWEHDCFRAWHDCGMKIREFINSIKPVQVDESLSSSNQETFGDLIENGEDSVLPHYYEFVEIPGLGDPLPKGARLKKLALSYKQVGGRAWIE